MNALMRIAGALMALSASGAIAAQEIVPAPTPNADALAAQMRVLAASPRNLEALLTAGDLSVRLGDAAAAMAFYARAQQVAPADARIVAGRAGALVLLGRPGEALQLYAQADRAGGVTTRHLAQRGLAHDLIGQQALAQRDYRRVVGAGDDETVRRLALSLGIAGQRDEAMALLDPLLRKSDRAAWRARAFILAMTGDLPGAERIATNMMPGGGAMAPFLRRLRDLSAADRAFAVHFGELTATPARIADARLAPGAVSAPVLASAPAGLPAPAADRGAGVTRATSAAPVLSEPARPGGAIASNWAMTPDTPAIPPTLPPPRPAPAPAAAPATVARVEPAPVRAPPPTPARRAANQALLASIIAQIDVPASELEVAPARVAAPPPRAEPPRPAPAARKPAPPAPDPARAEPARWWVQVAGGANAAALDRDWKRLAAKSPAAFRGKSAWTTPLRATNRLLAGPFRDQREAAAFVNALARDGSSAFAWRSEAGQKITRLDVR